MVLRVGAINGIFPSARITFFTTFIHEESGELEIFFVTGLMVKREQSNLLAFVFRDVVAFARPKASNDQFGVFERDVEHPPLAGRGIVGDRGLEKMARYANRLLRISQSWEQLSH